MGSILRRWETGVKRISWDWEKGGRGFICVCSLVSCWPRALAALWIYTPDPFVCEPSRVCVLWAANPLIQSAAVQALMWLHYHMHLKSSSCEPMQHANQRWNLVKEIGNWICLISWGGHPTGPSSARLTIRLICWLCVGSCNSASKITFYNLSKKEKNTYISS